MGRSAGDKRLIRLVALNAICAQGHNSDPSNDGEGIHTAKTPRDAARQWCRAVYQNGKNPVVAATGPVSDNGEVT
jgi:hypothetical protein